MSMDDERAAVPDSPHNSSPAGAHDPAALAMRLDELTTRMARLETLLSAWRTDTVPPPPLAVPMVVPPTQHSADREPLGDPPSTMFSETLPPRQASLEDRLGSQVFNRVGIVAVLIGTTWFLKWAMDNHWIGELGRVVIGLVAGAAIVVFSERFRRQGYSAFSWSLKAVGAGILYLSLWASFQVYHLLPAGVAFAAMVAVTLWNAYLAWSQDAEILAVYALVGGFSTPLLLTTGQDHAIFLFSYLLTLDLAIILLVRLKGWSRMLLGALPATAAYYLASYAFGHLYHQPAVAATFILLFLAAFAIPSLAIQWGDHEPGDASPSVLVDVLLPIASAAFTGLALYILLQDQKQHAWEPWVAVALGALYLGLTRLQRTRVATAIHLMLGIVYLTLAIPLKASGRWLALGWLAEAVALLWISSHLESSESTGDEAVEDTRASIHRTLRLLASAALALGFFDLIFLPFWHPQPHEAFLNARFASALAGLLALALAVRIATLQRPDELSATPTWPAIALAGTIAFNLVALSAVIVEIQTFWFGASGPQGPDAALREALSISAYLMAYGALLLAAGFWRRSAPIRWQALLLLLVSILKTFLYDMRTLSQGYRVASFLALGALLMAVSFAYQKDWLGLKEPVDLREETTP